MYARMWKISVGKSGILYYTDYQGILQKTKNAMEM